MTTRKPRQNSRTGSVKRPKTSNEASGMHSSREFRIGFLVHDVSRVRGTLFDIEMKPHGITHSQWWALAQVARSKKVNGGEEILQSDLARALDVGKTTVTGLIDRLEANGLVERRPDASDRRIKRIVVTDKGNAVLEQMEVVGRGLNKITYDGITDSDLKIVVAVLSRMKSNVIGALGNRLFES